MKSRNYWRKRASRTNNPSDWFTDKNLKHQVRKLIRAVESEVVKDQTQNNPRNTNCIWKALRLCIPHVCYRSLCFIFTEDVITFLFLKWLSWKGKLSFN